MRTTLSIDDDVLLAVKELAARDGRTAGAVLSDLARQSLTAPAAGGARAVARHGFAPLPSRGRTPISNALIDALRDEEGV